MKNYLDQSGKVALITGASSGIGAATAVLLAEMGAHVAIGYCNNESGALRVKSQITDNAGRAICVHGDVRKRGEVTSVVEKVVSTFGPIDILVNNAGSLVARISLTDIKEEMFDDIFDLNLKSALFCSQAVIPSMKERQSGTIINVASVAARNGGGPGSGAYSAAKGAMIALTKSLAKELAPDGIRVNAIAPGVIDTPFHEVFSTPAAMSNFAKAIPLGRIGTSVECAKVIAFMASDAASYLAGETIEVNGGLLML